jgi:leucyl-tRNA synthetase
MLAITKYADRLDKDLDDVNYLEKIKIQQRNWIGKSEGSEIAFKLIAGELEGEVSVFTTRADTLFGVTYVVLAPEHMLLESLKPHIENWSEVAAYVAQVKNKTDIERTAEDKEKTGVELSGVSAINPANGEKVSVWIADYVLASYGTGAVMAVPAHDERDMAFAKEYSLPIKVVIANDVLVGSGKFDGMTSDVARTKITEAVGGKIVTKYKLRDWVFSRQRYWGEPIPMIHCNKCGYVPVPEKDLPVTLPKVAKYEPTDNGESPLASIASWVNVKCPKCFGPAKRETDTMPNWAGSSWYFLRYTDPKDKKEFASKKALKYWMKHGVDWYNGGMEHTTLHLLYSRFWHKFLYDLKLVPTSEPYMKRTSHGMINAEGGVKMSKSLGNTVNPDEIVKNYGADTLRLYEMFMGPFDQAVAWSTASIIGPRRFVERLWRAKEKINPKGKSSSELETLLHKTIKKVGEDIETMGFNTAVSSFMILLNEIEKAESVSVKDFKMFLQILAPFVPHVADELWRELGEKKSIHISTWPKYDSKKLVDETIKIVVSVNGKVRAELRVSADMSEEEVRAEALRDKAIVPWIENKEIKKVIYVPGRLVNIVV